MKYQDMTEDYIAENSKDFTFYDWKMILTTRNLPNSFFREHKDHLNWGFITLMKKLDVDFVREFKDYLDHDALMLRLSMGGGFCVNETKEDLARMKEILKEFSKK